MSVASVESEESVMSAVSAVMSFRDRQSFSCPTTPTTLWTNIVGFRDLLNVEKMTNPTVPACLKKYGEIAALSDNTNFMGIYA